MNGSRQDLTPEVRALLDREREISPVSPVVRARALARARAAITAGPSTYAPRVARPPRLRWAVAAMVMFAAAAAVGAGAYQVRVRLAERTPVLTRHVVPASPAAPAAVVPAIAPDAVEPEEILPSAVAPVTHGPRLDASRQELRLLRQARAAVARQDFAGALAPLSEHARRFKDGRLTEEREALRIRALAGLGRTDEARRAAQRFEARFPRSVLLPTVRQMPAATP